MKTIGIIGGMSYESTIEYVKSIDNQTLQQAKNSAINNFHNKQLLKSAGIGALVAGVLTLGGNLIYNKVKKDKQSSQSV